MKPFYLCKVQNKLYSTSGTSGCEHFCKERESGPCLARLQIMFFNEDIFKVFTSEQKEILFGDGNIIFKIHVIDLNTLTSAELVQLQSCIY